MTSDVVEDPQMYLQLVALAHDIAAEIAKTPIEGLSGSTLYIAGEARRWAGVPRPAAAAGLNGPAAGILGLLRRKWPDLCARKTGRGELMAGHYCTWATPLRAGPAPPLCHPAVPAFRRPR